MANYRITSLLNFENVRKALDPRKFTDNLCEYLLNEGEAVMKKAYEQKDYTDRTYNLHDSYVAAVFNNGKCYGYRTLDPQATVRTGWYGAMGDKHYGTTKDGDFSLSGHEEAENFIRSYEASHGRENGVKLVVAADMFYADILEQKQGRLKRKYKVISHVSSEFDRLQSRGLSIKMKSYVGAPWGAIKVPSNVIRKNDIASGGRTFKGWK